MLAASNTLDEDLKENHIVHIGDVINPGASKSWDVWGLKNYIVKVIPTKYKNLYALDMWISLIRPSND